MAAAHAELARAYEVLAEVSENALAGFAEPSVTPEPPMTPTATKAAERASELLTTKDMVELLRCDERTLRRKELAGEIPAPVRTGRIKRWRRSDIDEWMEERAARVPRKGRLR